MYTCELNFSQNIARQVQIAELAIARIQFVEKKFAKLAEDSKDENVDEDVKEFVSLLLSTSEVAVENGRRGKIGRIVTKLIENNYAKVLLICDDYLYYHYQYL